MCQHVESLLLGTKEHVVLKAVKIINIAKHPLILSTSHELELSET